MNATLNMQNKFDTGPLSWIMAETCEAMLQAKLALLQALAQSPETQLTLLNHAKTYLHQAHGALLMVDVDGVAKLTQTIEVLLERMQDGQLAVVASHVEPIAQAFDGIHEYLDALVVSGIQQPVRLFPYYQQLQMLTGAERFSALDLFSPNLVAGSAINFIEGGVAANPLAVQPVDYAPIRKRFEKALLHLLSQKDPQLLQDSVLQLQHLLAQVWHAQPSSQSRAFWAVMHGFAELAADQKLYSEQQVKQVFGRINLQIRKLVEGTPTLPDSLLRDALFFIARAEQHPVNAAQIHAAYGLEGQVPANFELPHVTGIESGVLVLCKQRLSHIKTLWSKIAGGEAGLFEKFEQRMIELAEGAEKLRTPALIRLILLLTERAHEAATQSLNAAFSLEMATSLLFVESTLEQIARLPDDFTERAAIVAARLAAALHGSVPETSAPWLDEISQKVQQRQTMEVLVGEMQLSLRVVEKTLDDYFREPGDTSNLVQIDPIMHQIAGALAILDQEPAQAALQHTQELIREMVTANVPLAADHHAKIAHNIGALSFLIEFLQSQPDTARSKFTFNPDTGVLSSHFLEVLVPPQAQESAFEMVEPPLSEIPPGDAERLQEAIAPVPSLLPLPVGDDAVDAELLDVFLIEAEEVIACINENIPLSRGDVSNQEYLITLRRAFHTFKGSSRMVGLTAFGNAAWSMEQVMNSWLSEAKSGCEALYALLDKSAEVLGRWVIELASQGSSRVDGLALIAAAAYFQKHGRFVYETELSAPELSFDFTPIEKALFSEPQPGVDVPHQEAKIFEFPGAAEIFSPSSELFKKIGDINISVPLYTIYLAEADEILRFLTQDFAEWRHEPQRLVTTPAVHAAHSLAGSSATVGFVGLQEVAHALEMVLQRLERHPVNLLPGEFDTLEHCMLAIKEMLHTFALAEMPAPKPQQILVLEQLLAMLTERVPPVQPSDVESATPPNQPLSSPEMVVVEPMLVVQDDLDADLLPIFLEEASDLLPQIGNTLRKWHATPLDRTLAPALLRLLHTVKGSARMAGAMTLGQHTHDMESEIETLMQLGVVPALAIDALLAHHDVTMHLFEQLQQPAPLRQIDHVSADLDTPANDEVLAPTNTALVRVRADILDRLVNQAGEVSISRSRLENEVATLKTSLLELNDNVGRLRDQLREVEMQAETQIASRMAMSGEREFDPLEFDRFTRLQELTRMMAESVNDVSTLQASISKTVDGASDDLLAQARLTRELQQDLMRVRMVPFDSISERLYRITRQTSMELNKRVNLDIRGTSVEIDRGVLEKMAGPFEHLLRNAIVHGIENREQRQARGKNEVGEILVQIRQEGNEVVIHFNDDGAGLDMERIRAKALQAGLLSPTAEISDAEASSLIFEAGFSTASEVTELAGRGVGMDVVRSEATSLGGRVAVSSTPGIGTSFTIHLPLTLAVTQVVLINCGHRVYAIPSVLVEQVHQLKAPDLAAAYNDGAIIWQGQRIVMHYLATILGDYQALPVSQQYTPILIVGNGSERVALHVDEVIGNREVVVKNIGPQLSRMAGISGATVLGSGDIVLILNPLPLAQKLESDRLRVADDAEDGHSPVNEAMLGEVAQFPQPVQGLRRNPIVMVVDDSLTVRKVSQRLLHREGYQVVLAKDGVDALQQLQSITPDVMLVDIEMPRMDGFDLTRNVRNDARLAHIPIIIITSRTADKHRNYAQELGVNAYFGKPFQEDVLLSAIRSFLTELNTA